MLYIYGIQWIDHGGEYTHHTEKEDITDVMVQIGLNIEDLSSYGGIQTEKNHFWYIETSKELPEWNSGNHIYNMNLSENKDRFHDEHKLWMYTFKIHEQTIVAKCKPEDYCPYEGIDKDLVVDLIVEAGAESIDRNADLLIEWVMEVKNEIDSLQGDI